jgi:hypothetical protein
MDISRKDTELLLASLEPAGLSDDALSRLERAINGSHALDAALSELEHDLQRHIPCELPANLLDSMMRTVEAVPFALNQKVLLFPGARKESAASSKSGQGLRRMLAVAAVAMLGGAAALLTPLAPKQPQITGLSSQGFASPQSGSLAKDGIVATSFGTDVQNANDEGVIWTQDHKPCRVYRLRLEDRVLIRDENGVDRMLIIPREELYVLPEKVD